MSLSNPNHVTFDINGNPTGVSSSMSLPVGALGQLIAGVDSSGFVQYLATTSGSLQVTGSVATNVSFPSSIGAVIQNWPAVHGVSASAPFPVWNTGGPIGVSGTVTVGGQVSVNNFPATQNVSGSITVGTWGTNVTASVQFAPGGPPLQVWQAGTVGVSGTVSLAGQVSVNNFPAVQAVSGNVGAVIQNWPATIGVSASVPLRVWDAGITGVSASATLPVWNSGLVGVSGTVGVNNFPAVQAVSGTVTISSFPVMAVTGAYASGSTATAPIYPVMQGGLDQNNVVRPFRLDPQGRQTNQSANSSVTSVAASTSNQTLLSANPDRVGAIISNDGTNNIFVKFGATASTTSYTVKIGGNGYYEVPFTYTGRIDAVFSTNTGAAKITELT